MSENVEGTPVADEEVAEVQANEETVEETARSMPEVGTDEDPGSMLNR